MARGAEALTRLRELVDELAARETDLRMGVTGLPVLENDEMQASQSDIVRASLLSLVAGAVLFVPGFGAVRHPLMTVLTLLLTPSLLVLGDRLVTGAWAAWGRLQPERTQPAG